MSSENSENEEGVIGKESNNQDSLIAGGRKFSRRALLRAGVGFTFLSAFGGGVAELSSESSEEDTSSNKETNNNIMPSKAEEFKKFLDSVSELSPEISEAFKVGRIELNGPHDWKKYFTPITSEQARKILETTDSFMIQREHYFILPFDPRNSEHLILQNVEVPGKKGSTLVGSNISENTVLYSPYSGEATTVDVDIDGIPSIEIVVDRKTKQLMTAQIPGRLMPVEVEKPITERLKIVAPIDNTDLSSFKDKAIQGDILAKLSPRRAFGSHGNGELIMEVARVNNFDISGNELPVKSEDVKYNSSISHLATYNGKIAFIETSS